MQIVSSGDNLHEISNPVFWKNKTNIPKCSLLKFLPRMRGVKFDTRSADIGSFIIFLYIVDMTWLESLIVVQFKHAGKSFQQTLFWFFFLLRS